MQASSLILAAVLLAAGPSAAHRSLAQTSFPLPNINTPEILQSLPVNNETKSLIQGTINDVFSAFAYSSNDQQKIGQTPKPQPGVFLNALACISHLLYFSNSATHHARRTPNCTPVIAAHYQVLRRV